MALTTWRMLGAAGRTASIAGNATGRALTGSLQTAAANRGRRAARRGLLPPGAPPPPPGSGDYYDYRGLLPARALRPLAGGPYSLGGAVDLRTGRRTGIGLGDADLNRHAAVVGSTGSGKTTGVMIPWMLAALRQGHSVIAVDVAGDLEDQILAAGARQGGVSGRIARWDLTAPARSMSWNWLNELDTHEAVTAAVEALVGRERPNDPQPFFGQRDRRILGGLIGSAREALRAPTAGQLLEIARNQDLLSRVAAGSPRHGRRLDEATTADSWDYGRLMSGVINALTVFEHPGLRAITAVDRFRLGHLFDEPSLLILGAPLHASRDGVSASSLGLNLAIRELYRGFGVARRHLFLFADEMPRLIDRVDFEQLTSVGRRAGGSVVLAAQFVEQIADENQRTAIFGNCATYVSLPTTSQVSAAYFASRLGDRRETVLGQSVQSPSWHSHGSRQWTRATESTAVLGAREILDQPWSAFPALVHASTVSSSPFAVDLTDPR